MQTNQQQPPTDPAEQIKQKYGSVTNFYRQIAQQTGTTPDRVMEEVEKMGNNQMPAQAPNPNMPQTSMGGANAQTPVSQVANGPTPAMQPAVQAQQSQLQNSGMAPAQAMNQAATNPQNSQPMAKGGTANKKPAQKPLQAPPTPDQIAKEPMPPSAEVKAMMQAMGSDGMPKQVQGNMEPDGGPNNMAKGGKVPNLGNLKLKEIMNLLATHPGLAGDPSPSAQAGSSGYASGGPVKTDNTQMSLLDMASGGGLYGSHGEGGQEEEDQITGYGPDGEPIIQNADGTTGYGDVNQLLGRPENASTLGTGDDPSNATSKSAANAPLMGMAMAKGGADKAPPPGSLPNEVADKIPANLSEGEFVMSADATRFWGLSKLTAMQDFARQQLSKLNQSGGIRSPGDGQDPTSQAGFQQSTMPNENWYSPDEKGQQDDQDGDEQSDEGMACGGEVDAKLGGLMGRAKGGPAIEAEGFGKAKNPTKTQGVRMANGGTAEEEQFAKGGGASRSSYGRDNILSSHPQGGSTSLDYNKGGVGVPTKKQPPQRLDKGGTVGNKSQDLAPFPKSESAIPSAPTNSLKLPKPTKAMKPAQAVKGPKPHVNPYGMGKFGMNKGGGLLRDINQAQSIEA